MDGTVTFYDGGTSLGVGTITDNGLGDDKGTATFSTSSLAIGSHGSARSTLGMAAIT